MTELWLGFVDGTYEQNIFGSKYIWLILALYPHSRIPAYHHFCKLNPHMFDASTSFILANSPFCDKLIQTVLTWVDIPLRYPPIQESIYVFPAHQFDGILPMSTVKPTSHELFHRCSWWVRFAPHRTVFVSRLVKALAEEIHHEMDTILRFLLLSGGSTRGSKSWRVGDPLGGANGDTRGDHRIITGFLLDKPFTYSLW